MFEDGDLKVLLGNSIELLEEDYDDAEVESMTGYPVEETALMEYYFVSITNHIGEPSFKDEYLSVLPFVKTYLLKDQKVLCEAILKKIEEKHDYSPSVIVDVVSEEAIFNVLKLLEFIEYDHEEFIIDVWKFLKPDSNSFQIEKFCEQKGNEIVLEIEEQSGTRYMPELITNFLRTNNKENILDWFCEKSKDLRISILIELERN